MNLLRFLRNRWVRLIVTVCSVIGVPLTVVLYWNSVKERDLTYSVYPIRTPVLQSGYSTGLRVLYQNEEVKTDVTALQLAIWNRGREPILKDNILKQITIVTHPFVKILEVSVQKPSRSVIEFSVDHSPVREGVVPLSWKLLEQSDGAIVQLLYAGPPQVDVSLEGIVLGQTKITRLVYEDPEVTKTSGPPVRSRTWNLIYRLFMILFSCMVAAMIWRRMPPQTRAERIFWVLIIAGMLLWLYQGIRELKSWYNSPEPPFGFFIHIPLQDSLQLPEHLGKMVIPEREQKP